MDTFSKMLEFPGGGGNTVVGEDGTRAQTRLIGPSGQEVRQVEGQRGNPIYVDRRGRSFRGNEVRGQSRAAMAGERLGSRPAQFTSRPGADAGGGGGRGAGARGAGQRQAAGLARRRRAARRASAGR